MQKPFVISRLGRLLRWLFALRTWQLGLLLIPLVFVSVSFLRLNNLGMVERRDEVLSADKQGDTPTIQRSLADLQSYVSAHMNTGLGNGVSLQYSYDRARDAALDSATDSTNPNSAVYQQASVECRAKWQYTIESFRNDYVQCVIDRVQSLSPATDPVASAKLPQADDYRYDYVSPVWSPDFAGLFTLLSALVLVLIVIRGLAWLALWLFVRRLQRRA